MTRRCLLHPVDDVTDRLSRFPFPRPGRCPDRCPQGCSEGQAAQGPVPPCSILHRGQLVCCYNFLSSPLSASSLTTSLSLLDDTLPLSLAPSISPSSWCKPNDLTHLDQDKIDAYLNSDNKKKDGKLQRSYETARDPAEWEASLQGPDDEDEDEEDELEEDVPAATGSKRKAGGSDKKETKKPKVEKKPKVSASLHMSQSRPHACGT